MSTGLHESVSIRNEASQNASNVSNPSSRINTSECQELEGTRVDISSVVEPALYFKFILYFWCKIRLEHRNLRAIRTELSISTSVVQAIIAQAHSNQMCLEDDMMTCTPMHPPIWQ